MLRGAAWASPLEDLNAVTLDAAGADGSVLYMSGVSQAGARAVATTAGCLPARTNSKLGSLNRSIRVTFEARLYLSCVRGMLACPEESTVTRECTAAWPAISEQLGTGCAAAANYKADPQCGNAGASPLDTGLALEPRLPGLAGRAAARRRIGASAHRPAMK